MKEAQVRTRYAFSVTARAALVAVFALVTTLAIGCHSDDPACNNGEFRCDSSRKEIQKCVNESWELVESCFGVDEFCAQGLGRDCYGPDTACCVLVP